MRDTNFKLFMGLIVFLCLLFILAIFVMYDDCKSRGGEMVPNGVYNTTYVYSGNVMIPITSEGSKCSH